MIKLAVCIYCLFGINCLSAKPEWASVAFSTSIVVGHWIEKVPPPEAWTKGQEERGLLREFQVERWLKGEIRTGDIIELRLYGTDMTDDVRRVISTGGPLVMFLQREWLSDNTVRYVFINPPSSGVAMATAETETAVLKEVTRQEKILKDYEQWSRPMRTNSSSLMTTVGSRLLDPNTREQAVADILALRAADAPMLILVMDDRRKFGAENRVLLGLKGPDGGYDARCVTYPEELIDLFCEALDIVTGGQTHINMRSRVTADKRRFAIDAWRIYLFLNFVENSNK